MNTAESQIHTSITEVVRQLLVAMDADVVEGISLATQPIGDTITITLVARRGPETPSPPTTEH